MKRKRPCDTCPVLVMCKSLCDDFFDYLDHTYNSDVTVGDEFKKKVTPKSIEKIARKNKDTVLYIRNPKKAYLGMPK